MSQDAERGPARTAGRGVDPGWPAVIVTDASGTVVHWSRSAAAVYGWTADEAVGTPIVGLTTDPAHDEQSNAVMEALAHGMTWEGVFRVRHRDGSAFDAHVLDTPVLDAEGGLVGILGLSYPVGEDRFPLLAAERAARASSERSAERLRRLQQVTAELSRAADTEEAARTVLARGIELEGAGSGALWLLDGSVLRLVSSAGNAPGAARFPAIPVDAELPGPQVVRTGEAMFLRSRAERDARWPVLVGVPTAMEAQAVVPLVVEGQGIGCLSFGFSDEREFGAGERDFLEALANVCAQVLDRARLHDAERAASGRVAFLADASRVLNGSLEYDVTLEQVVSMLLGVFASLVVVDVLGHDGTLRRAAMGHVDPTKRELLERLRRNPLRAGTHAWEVLRTGVPRIVAEVTEEDVRRATDTEERHAAARELASGPAMIVPLSASGRTIGLLYLARSNGAAAFTDDDLALAVDLAARAGSAVENARLYAARTSVVETLQRSLLPPRLPEIEGLELGARYRSAHAGLEVGGDFYDCYRVGDGWAFMLGDVVGTGPRAAAVTALVRHTARAVAPYVDGPAEVVHAVRDALVAGDDDEVFCTMLYGSISPASPAAEGFSLAVVGAGHPPPFLVAGDGTVSRVETNGGLLGALPPLDIAPVDVLLRPGEALVCVTDGVLEARPAVTWETPDPGDQFFDEAGVREVLERHAGAPADEIAGAIEAAVLEFAQGRASDDVAVLVLRARA